jgi:EpsI family protein
MSESPIVGAQTAPEQPRTRVVGSHVRGPSATLLATVVAIIGGGVLLTASTSDVAKVSEPGVKLVDGHLFLDARAGDWSGGELHGLNELEKKALPPDTEGARRIYTDKNGNEVYCSVILAGRESTSIHRPEYCLPGQGWNPLGEHVQTIPVTAAPGGSLGVMRMNAIRSLPMPDGRTELQRAVFVYWFIGKNRVTPYHWQRIFWNMCDRVLHNTNHRWAYVLIYVPVTDEGVQKRGEASDKAMNVVARFVQDIYPTMSER